MGTVVYSHMTIHKNTDHLKLQLPDVRSGLSATEVQQLRDHQAQAPADSRLTWYLAEYGLLNKHHSK